MCSSNTQSDIVIFLMEQPAKQFLSCRGMFYKHVWQVKLHHTWHAHYTDIKRTIRAPLHE